MQQVEPALDETERLRRSVSDSIGLFALPAAWDGAGAEQIAQSLLDALVELLHLDLGYVLLSPSDDKPAVERVTAEATGEPQGVAAALRSALGDDLGAWPSRTRCRVAGVELSIVSLRLGLRGEIGVLVAASQRPDFADVAETLLLNVAANQAVIALQGARLNQRQGAEEALLGSERSARAIIDGLPGFVATLARDGAVEAVNRTIVEYTGQPLEGLRDWGTNGTVHPDDMPHVAEIFVKSVAAGTPYVIEQRLRRHDGAYRWFDNRGVPVRDASGAVVRWCVLLTDIDEKRQVEEALRESERQSRLIVDTIPGGIAVLNPEGELQGANRHLLQYVDQTVGELKDWGANGTIHPDDLANTTQIFARSLESGAPYELETRLRRFDGVYRWFQIRGLPLRDESGGILRWYVLVTDIDERRRAEEKLRRSEAFLAEGQRLSSTGSFSWRLDKDELTFSDELYRIFELEQQQPVKLEQVVARVHPEDIPLLTRKIELARAGVDDHDYDIRLQMPDGRIRYLRSVARAIPQRDGQWEYLGTIQDVTERRQSEDALANVRSELAHVTRTMSLGVLTASIAHEVNQPLSGIITNASTCLRLLGANPPNIQGALETARRTIRDGQRASEVIVRLRALFRKKEFVTEAVDLNEATREVLALSASDLQRRRITLETEFDEELPLVSGDRVQLQQVILNLLLNACDAIKAVEDRPKQVFVQTTRDENGAARLMVRDSGIGVVEDSQDRLFDAFYTTKTDGMGMGLSVSRSIIESHHGRLWHEPNDEHGATFIFSIPLNTSESGR